MGSFQAFSRAKNAERTGYSIPVDQETAVYSRSDVPTTLDLSSRLGIFEVSNACTVDISSAETMDQENLDDFEKQYRSTPSVYGRRAKIESGETLRKALEVKSPSAPSPRRSMPGERREQVQEGENCERTFGQPPTMFPLNGGVIGERQSNVDYTPGSMTSTENTPETEGDKTISDPLTIAGQRIGAYLSIMRFPSKIKKVTKGSEYTMCMEVGDVVKVLSKTSIVEPNGRDHLEYAVENLRTGARVFISWDTFLPVGEREICDCRGQRCRCVFVDFGKSMAFAKMGSP